MRVKVWVEHPYEGCPRVDSSFIIPDALFDGLTIEAKNNYIERCAEDALDTLVYSLTGNCGWEIEEETTNE